MEVHHHTQTSRKKWTHYFWEFLMLFLAVFCGFLAENFREHQVEKRRGKQYIRSLYQDLKTDTANFRKWIAVQNSKIEEFHTIKNCHDSITKHWKNSDCMLGLIQHSRSNIGFTLTDRTIKQLEAGGFRLLPKEDADSIIRYVTFIKSLNGFESTIYQQAQDDIRRTFNVSVDFNANAEMQPEDTSHYVIPRSFNLSLNIPILLSQDRVMLNKYFNELLQYRQVTITHRNFMETGRERAIILINYLNNKYQLE
jgi:hypothetical protein